MTSAEEIKSKLDIVDIIREYLPLKPAGVNFRALCPFHHEKTPSFNVNPDKQIWHCFGCGKGGDVFAFVMEMENLEFMEALRLLAPKAGVTLRSVDPKESSIRQRLLEAMAAASRYYHELLINDQRAASARAYLERRGLDQLTIDTWQIGYSLDAWDELMKYLAKQGFRENELFLAGLIVKSEKSAGYYDRFRGRIMFPWRDHHGQIVAFSARLSPEKEAVDKMGKYINSPQTQIYDKGRVIFGLDRAKQAIKKAGRAVLVEGQMDVITAHRRGFENVAGVSGTALTADQVALLKRYTEEVVLGFDMDAAGDTALRRAAREALAAGLKVRVLSLPSGKDPDEFLNNHPEQWPALIDQAPSLPEHLLKAALAKSDRDTPEGRREVAKDYLPLLVMMTNQIDRDFWLGRLAQAIDVPEAIIRETLAGLMKKTGERPAPVSPSAPSAPDRRVTRGERGSELFLVLLLKFPELLEQALRRIEVFHLENDTYRRIYKDLLLFYNKSNQGQSADTAWFEFHKLVSSSLADQPVPYRQTLDAVWNRLAMLGDRDYHEYTPEMARLELATAILLLKRSYLEERNRELERMIRQAESEKDDPRAGELMGELKGILEELKALGKTGE